MPRRKRHSVSCAQLIIPIICIFSGCLQTGPLSSADPSPEDTSVSHPDAGIHEEGDDVSIESNDTPDESPESDDSNRNESTPNSPPCEPEASPESEDSTDANNLPTEDEQSEDGPSPDEPASQDDSLPGSEDTVNGCANPLSQVLESLSIQLVVTATWASGQSVDGVITNHGSAALDSLLLYAEDPSLIASIWGLIPSGNGYTLPSWNSGLAPGESVSFGMTTSGQELPCFSLAPEAADPAHDEPSSPPTGSGEAPGETTSPVLPDDRKIVAYFVEWGVYQRDYHVADIPADLITHLNYAFADISESGECILYDAYAATDKFYPGDSWEARLSPGKLQSTCPAQASSPSLEDAHFRGRLDPLIEVSTRCIHESVAG